MSEIVCDICGRKATESYRQRLNLPYVNLCEQASCRITAWDRFFCKETITEFDHQEYGG